MATSALTQAGRTAKVRVLLTDILGEWRGAGTNSTGISPRRALLSREFAGVTAEELADV